MKTKVNIGLKEQNSITGVEFDKPFKEITYNDIRNAVIDRLGGIGESVVIQGWANADPATTKKDNTELVAWLKRVKDYELFSLLHANTVKVLIQKQPDGSGITVLRAYASGAFTESLAKADMEMLHKGADNLYKYELIDVPYIILNRPQ